MVESLTSSMVTIEPDWLFKGAGGRGCDWFVGEREVRGEAMKEKRCKGGGRRKAISKVGIIVFAASVVNPAVAAAVLEGGSKVDKMIGISNEDIAIIVKRDVVAHQFLMNGRLTRSIFDEGATFQDEIDTYTLDKWIKGTSRLFNARNSHVELVGEVRATEEEVRFR